jgi:4'-phosphopantetheinyl transferase
VDLPHIATQALHWVEDAPLPEILAADERQRCLRFARAADRARYAQAHVFLRQTLSRFADVAPAEWRFARGPFGRPYIAGPPSALELDFNLSHTRDWAACVVTRGVACGVDIERIRPVAQAMEIARSRFARQETAELQALAGDARLRRFFELWTEKEAWVKACGRGLALGMDRVVGAIPGVELLRFAPTERHVMAVLFVGRRV